jgi:hypothetical protein
MIPAGGGEDEEEDWRPRPKYRHARRIISDLTRSASLCVSAALPDRPTTAQQQADEEEVEERPSLATFCAKRLLTYPEALVRASAPTATPPRYLIATIVVPRSASFAPPSQLS